DDELAWLVHDLNDVAAEYPSEPTIHELVLRIASGTPDAIAIDDADGEVTYAELIERADAIAEPLTAAQLRPCEAVGVIFPRGADCVAAMLGVLVAGGVYVPIALDEPEARRERLLDQLGIRLLLHARPSGGLELVSRAADGLVVMPAVPGEEGSTPLYVMFTSGSTGDPKAVVVTHRGAMRLVRDPRFVGITSEDGIGFASNPAFDAATWEVWGALTNGARLVPLAPWELTRAEAFEARIRARRVSCLFLTTSLFNSHARTTPKMFGGLRMLGIGGEAADPSMCRRVLASGSPPDALINAYGPTETTTFASWHRVSSVPEGAVRLPIGGPISNTTLHVLDRHGRLVPAGVPGELFIGGDALAIGYHGDPELTARKFVPDPFSGPPHRLYATGDLVVREPDGPIVFLRRRDQQLKVRGYRVEPIEIEAAMRDIDGVTAAVVVPRELEGYPRLVGYAIVDTPAVDESIIRTKLRATLPDYLVPSHIVLVDDLPLTRSGKLDRAQLPDPFATTVVTPPSPISVDESVDDRLDASIADLWYEVLGAHAVDPDATFFEAGGDSLLAVRLYGTVQRRFGVVLPSGTIDQGFTVARFVAAVRTALQRSAPPLVIEMTTTDGPLIVLVSPGGGELDRYRWLVHLLADRFHVVGVREPGHYGTEARPRTMADVSSACLDGLRQAGFEAPVAVVGECSGGVLAHQLACDFARQGQPPELAVLLDTPVPGAFDADAKPEQFATLVRRRGRNAIALARMQVQWSWHRARHEPAPVALAHSMTLRNNARRVREARPSFFDGHVLYVQAVDDHDEAATNGAPDYWRRRARSAVVITASGTHVGTESFLSQSNAGVTAEAIARELKPFIETGTS
ncbi:MAG TPA: amino acid adenylation domain-containing protein, partial [Acidimicrobiia bacterium]|nr:amino acid adenylation domain-containing protein [Acidimicrobiia bacterium]